MRELSAARTAIAAMVSAILLVTGCGSNHPEAAPEPRRSSASPSADASKSPSSSAEKTRSQAESDLRFAAQIISGELRIPDAPLGRECAIDATALSPEVPGEAELQRVVGRLRTRGWELDGTASVDEGAFLVSGKWSLIAGAGPVPAEMAEQAGSNKGALTFSARGACSKA
ncbi:hypothetical protein [Streptomyces sp. NPDC002088]|uniref:hypothetical protein n=1 Tax=Streptomyces sp. NPDC002088 TaxID=3154665 RepID=UPI00332ABD20